MKKILLVGDSFVKDVVPTYANCVAKEFSCDVIGLPGSGNDCISNTVMSNFLPYECIIINWSSTCRYDIQITDKFLIKMFKTDGPTHNIVNNKFWLSSGGWRGLWQKLSHKVIFEAIYKHHFQIEDAWRRSLTNILLTQNLLYNENKKIFQMFSYDTFESQSFCEYEKKYQSTRLYNKERWQKFCQANSWIKNIRWDDIWFYKNQYTSTGGIMDWCHDNTDDIGHHPTEKGHQQFYHSIIKPWIEQHN